jgi:hypothetical protein
VVARSPYLPHKETLLEEMLVLVLVLVLVLLFLVPVSSSLLPYSSLLNPYSLTPSLFHIKLIIRSMQDRTTALSVGGIGPFDHPSPVHMRHPPSHLTTLAPILTTLASKFTRASGPSNAY